MELQCAIKVRENELHIGQKVIKVFSTCILSFMTEKTFLLTNISITKLLLLWQDTRRQSRKFSTRKVKKYRRQNRKGILSKYGTWTFLRAR